MRKFKKFAAGFAAAAMAFTMVVTMTPSIASAAVSKEGEKAAKAEFDPNGTYHAYFGLEQTGSWIFRNPWYSEELGKTGTDLSDDVPYESILKSQDGVQKMDGTVIDAEITGNGVYTVGAEGLNNILKDAEAQDSTSVISMLFVSTDVPASAKDTFKISDWKLVIDGNEQSLPAEVFYNEEAEETCAVIRFDAVNTYMKDKGEYADCPSILTPSDSIKIVFTVSGMANDNPDAVEATEAPAEDTTSGDDASSAGNNTGSTSSSDEEESGTSPMSAVAVVVILVVVAGVAVVVTKKKK